MCGEVRLCVVVNEMDREKIRVSKFILAPVLALILVCMAPVVPFTEKNV